LEKRTKRRKEVARSAGEAIARTATSDEKRRPAVEVKKSSCSGHEQ
jgi:hypothetical protein